MFDSMEGCLLKMFKEDETRQRYSDSSFPNKRHDAQRHADQSAYVSRAASPTSNVPPCGVEGDNNDGVGVLHHAWTSKK